MLELSRSQKGVNVMNQHTINYETLKHLSYIRFGHKIGRGWYAILITAEKELCDLGISIRNVKRVDGALIVSIERCSTDLTSEVKQILYKAELDSEMTCEWCGNYSVSQTIIDNETYTICEECQDSCESLAGIEKRILLQKIHELEQMNYLMRNELTVQKVNSEQYRMGVEQFKMRSEKLCNQLKKNGRKPSVFCDEMKQ